MKSIHHYKLLSLCVSCLVCAITNQALYAQVLPQNKPLSIKTSDQMHILGKIEKEEDHTITLNTPYGDLEIPLANIDRVNGDKFDPQKGIIREHSVSIFHDGSVLLNYIQPISIRNQQQKIQLLALGRVIEILSLDGQPLKFTAIGIQDFTRCQLISPPLYNPAVRMKVRQAQKAQIEDQTLTYTYPYTPRSDQLFHIEYEIPDGATIITASPEPISQEDNRIVWENQLTRQTPYQFSVTLRLASPQ